MRLAVFLIPSASTRASSDPGRSLPLMEDLVRQASKEGGYLQIYTGIEFDALLCTYQESEDLDWRQLIGDNITPTNTSINWAIYEPLEPITVGGNTPLPETHIMVYNAMTPSPENEQDFNDWYAKEHIPLLSRAETWLSSRRYSLLDSNFPTPSYLALHFWGNESAFNSAAYKTAIDTPWKWRVVDHVLDRRRYAFHSLSIGIDYQ